MNYVNIHHRVLHCQTKVMRLLFILIIE